MLGAIIGDIVGSVYEWHNIKTKDFPLFREDCFFTDDTVMTCAVAEAVMNGGERDDFIDAMKKYGRMYPNAGYGGRFGMWIRSDDREPYNSYGNGSAMRVSPCAWVMDCGFCARTGMWPSNGMDRAKLSAEVTHNHPEGIKGAMAVADAIFMCRYYFGGYHGDYEKAINDDADECKKRIRGHIEKEYGYDLSKTLDEIRPIYKFNETCQETVPQAIIAFLESTDFEDAIRNAISLGGDSDTLAAITGSIAEAAYVIPDWIKEKAYSYLDEPLRKVLRRWKKFVREPKSKAGKNSKKGTDYMDIEEQIEYIQAMLDRPVDENIFRDFWSFLARNDYFDHSYSKNLPKKMEHGLNDEVLQGASWWSEKKCLAVLTWLTREEHWVGYTFGKRWEKGHPQKVLKRLMKLLERKSNQEKYIKFNNGCSMTKVEQVLNLIPPEDVHYVEEWKEGKVGFNGGVKEWLRTKDPIKDDAEIATRLASAIAIARKYDSEQRTKRGSEMSNRECSDMEKRNIAFIDKCKELGIQV